MIAMPSPPFYFAINYTATAVSDATAYLEINGEMIESTNRALSETQLGVDASYLYIASAGDEVRIRIINSVNLTDINAYVFVKEYGYSTDEP